MTEKRQARPTRKRPAAKTAAAPPAGEVSVRVCMGTGGIAAGGDEVLAAFRGLFEKKGIAGTVGRRCEAHKVGCRGFCAKDVLVDVIINGAPTTYQLVRPAMVERIVDEHIVAGTPVQDYLVGADYEAFHSRQQKLVLHDCGKIDPESLDAYLAVGGYQAARKALTEMSPDAVIKEMKHAGLRGRGGAGFPTGIKWEFCRRAEGDPKYLICNADEGDPGAFMDRAIIEGDPHAVIEGMIIGGYAIGSQEGFVYIRAEYPLAVARLRRAIAEARERGYLGRGIMGLDFDFDIHVKLGAGAFVCGEETALISSIEDNMGEPKPKPPFPAQKGLWGKPTNINNVETWATVPKIIDKGASWFASIGTKTSKGTKIFSLVGKINNTGLVEVPMGIPLREIIYDIGGGIPKNKGFKAVQTGGPSGGCIPASHLDIPVDYENLAALGSIVGSGGMVVMDEDTCMVDVAKFFVSFCLDESCGQCAPCREGTRMVVKILGDITAGRATADQIPVLEELCQVMKEASLCGLGKTAPNPVLSTLRYFRDEYDAHIHDRRCPAKVCRDLIVFAIDPAKCTGCGACAVNCPQKAIAGQRRKPHAVLQDRCIKCGACYDACRFGAVERR